MPHGLWGGENRNSPNSAKNYVDQYYAYRRTGGGGGGHSPSGSGRGYLIALIVLIVLYILETICR